MAQYDPVKGLIDIVEQRSLLTHLNGANWSTNSFHALLQTCCISLQRLMIHAVAVTRIVADNL